MPSLCVSSSLPSPPVSPPVSPPCLSPPPPLLVLLRNDLSTRADDNEALREELAEERAQSRKMSEQLETMEMSVQTMMEAHETHQDVINGLRKALQVAHAEAEVRPFKNQLFILYSGIYLYSF
jgi:hypothetical protein